MKAAMGMMKNKMIREKVNVFMTFVFLLCGGDCIWGSQTVWWFCTLLWVAGRCRGSFLVPRYLLLWNIPSIWLGKCGDRVFPCVRGSLWLHILLHCLLGLVVVGGSLVRALKFPYSWWGGRHGKRGGSSIGRECVTVRGHSLIFSVVHLPPLTANSPFTFTVLIIFFADTFHYIVW